MALAAKVIVWLYYSPIYVVAGLVGRSLGKFLNNQRLTQFPFYAALVGQISSVALHATLIPRYGFEGSVIAFGLGMSAQAAVLAISVVLHPQARRSFGSWSLSRAFNPAGLREYMRLGLPSAAYIAGEVAIFDVTSIIAGTLGPQPAAAWGIIHSIYVLVVGIVAGFSASGCALVGACIGKRLQGLARLYALATLCTSILFSIAVSMLLAAQYHTIFALYDPHVVEIVSVGTGGLLLFLILDAVQFTFQGIFSALGRNDIGAVVMVSTLWLVGFPLMLMWSKPPGSDDFRGITFLGVTVTKSTGGIVGLLYAMNTALIVNVPVAAYAAFRWINWEALVPAADAAAA